MGALTALAPQADALFGLIGEGSPTARDCSTATRHFEYNVERCHNDVTQAWINGHCKDGVKEEIEEPHLYQHADGGRLYCRECVDGPGELQECLWL
jgi:hypothetical protein